MMKQISKIFLLLVAGILLGGGILCVVYLFPTSGMQRHVQQSLDIFLQEGESPVLLEGFKGSTLDNYTDALMLANACYKSEHVFYEAAMLVERKSNEEGEPIESLAGYLLENTGEVRVYARYWHGYLVLLKPFLLILDYGQIRVLNILAFVAVVSAMMAGFYRRRMWRGMVAFVAAFISMFPFAIPFSLQFSTVFYIGIGACIYMLWKHENLKQEKKFFRFFLITGMLTSFMDYLTYPLFTFGMPLVIFVVLEQTNGWEKVMKVVKAGFYWGLGYTGMWLGKWLLGSVLLGTNLFKEAIEAVATRLSHEANGEAIRTMTAVLRNCYILFNIVGLCIAVFLMGWICISVRKFKNQVKGSSIGVLALIACVPFCWYMVIANHSYVHYWFTFRNLAVSIFALGMISESLYRESVRQEE